MAADTYSYETSTYSRLAKDAAEESRTSGYRDPAGTAFVWIGWVIAFAFWVSSTMIFFGILEALARGGPDSIRGGFDPLSGGFLYMDVIGGFIVLGAAIAWGAARGATRDKRLDAVTEAATAELYDTAGRDDRTTQ